MDAGEAAWNLRVVSKTPPSEKFVGGTNSDLAFTRVIATSTSNAFEFDNVAYNPVNVPEPASMLLLGTGLVATAAFGRRKLARAGR